MHNDRSLMAAADGAAAEIDDFRAEPEDIAPTQIHEVADTLGVSAEALRAAIQQVGPNLSKVRAHFVAHPQPALVRNTNDARYSPPHSGGRMNTQTTNTQANITKDKFVSDIKTVVSDTEALAKAAAANVGERALAARDKLRESLADFEALVIDRATETCEAADTYVRENPWRSIGVAAGFGLILGLVISRDD